MLAVAWYILCGVVIVLSIYCVIKEKQYENRRMKFQNLKRIRKAKKVSQAKLAEALGVCQGTVGDWEMGIREPELKDLPRIAEVLGVGVGDLIKSCLFKILFKLKADTQYFFLMYIPKSVLSQRFMKNICNFLILNMI